MRKSIGTIIVIILITAFIFLSVVSMLSAIKIYLNTADSANSYMDNLVGLHYVITKIKENNRVDSIKVENNILSFYIKDEDTDYVDMLYFQDGNLMEIFTDNTEDCDYENGIIIQSCDNIIFKQVDNENIQVVYVDNNKEIYNVVIHCIGGALIE